MEIKRYGCGAAVLDGKIYVCGGREEGIAEHYLDSVEVYDPESDRYLFSYPYRIFC